MKKLNSAIIGLGYIGESHIEAINRIGLCNLVGVYDANEELAKAKAEYYGIKKTAKSRQKLIRKKQNRDTSNDIIIPLDECLLSDVEDEEEVF